VALYRLVSFSNSQPGRDDEFNDWYNDVHLPDVLKVTGFTAAQRFKLSGLQRGGESAKHKYLTVYEIDTDDIAAVMKELSQRVGTELMPLSGALADERCAFLFEPITDRVSPKTN
jgi:hypothetical protein